MTQGERVKEIRKSLGLTQEKFGERIGLRKNSLSQIESGVNNLSEQNVLAICREFHVSEAWLRDGDGEMFLPAPSDALELLAAEYGLDDGESVLVEKYVRMAPGDRRVILDYLCECAAAILSGRKVGDVRDVRVKDVGEMTIDEKVEAYRRELEKKEQAEGKSGAS